MSLRYEVFNEADVSILATEGWVMTRGPRKTC